MEVDKESNSKAIVPDPSSEWSHCAHISWGKKLLRSEIPVLAALGRFCETLCPLTFLSRGTEFQVSKKKKGSFICHHGTGSWGGGDQTDKLPREASFHRECAVEKRPPLLAPQFAQMCVGETRNTVDRDW